MVVHAKRLLLDTIYLGAERVDARIGSGLIGAVQGG